MCRAMQYNRERIEAQGLNIEGFRAPMDQLPELSGSDNEGEGSNGGDLRWAQYVKAHGHSRVDIGDEERSMGVGNEGEVVVELPAGKEDG